MKLCQVQLRYVPVVAFLSVCGIKKTVPSEKVVQRRSGEYVRSGKKVSHFEVCLVRKQVKVKSQNRTKDLAYVFITYFETISPGLSQIKQKKAL